MKASLRHRLTICLAAVAVIVLGVALAPGAQAKGGFKSCADKQIKVTIKSTEGKPTKLTLPAKAVAVKGTTCAAAYEFIRLSYSGELKGSHTYYPQNYNCKPATFHVPVGYIPEICTKGGKTIKYATRGG